LSTWSCPDLATEAVNRGIIPAVSASSIRRILVRDTLKPWQHQSWIFIRDPQFAVKAARVFGLYAREYDGVALGALAYLAAYDVHQARVVGNCSPKTGIGPFMALVEQAMTQEPYASAKRGCLLRWNGVAAPFGWFTVRTHHPGDRRRRQEQGRY
jgi:hypothetical protein